MKYAERIPEVQAGMASCLLILGDGNWKMGEGVPLKVKQKLGAGDERTILEHFVCQSTFALRLLF